MTKSEVVKLVSDLVYNIELARILPNHAPEYMAKAHNKLVSLGLEQGVYEPYRNGYRTS